MIPCSRQANTHPETVVKRKQVWRAVHCSTILNCAAVRNTYRYTTCSSQSSVTPTSRSMQHQAAVVRRMLVREKCIESARGIHESTTKAPRPAGPQQVGLVFQLRGDEIHGGGLGRTTTLSYRRAGWCTSRQQQCTCWYMVAKEKNALKEPRESTVMIA